MRNIIDKGYERLDREPTLYDFLDIEYGKMVLTALTEIEEHDENEIDEISSRYDDNVIRDARWLNGRIATVKSIYENNRVGSGVGYTEEQVIEDVLKDAFTLRGAGNDWVPQIKEGIEDADKN